MINSKSFVAVLFVLGPWRAAIGCSCIPGSLEQQYQQAGNVLIAEITGCASDAIFKHGSCGSHGWIFETVEDLKGSNAQIQRLPSEINSNLATSCDVFLEVGKKYLMFLYEGRTDQCGGTKDYDAAMSEVEVLRAYRDKRTATITKPWYFDDSFGSCSLSHELEEATLRFEYVFKIPEVAPVPSGSKFPPKPAPVMVLEPRESFELSGQTLIEIGKRKVTLMRNTAPAADGNTYPFDFAGGEPVMTLLGKLGGAKEVVVSGIRSASGGAAEPFRMVTSALQGSTSIGRFKACMAAHPNFESR